MHKLSGKTFLLGVGAPRCGTTWLYRFLSEYQQVDFGLRKEYHVFDSVHVDGFQYFSVQNRLFTKNQHGTIFEAKNSDEILFLKSLESNHKNYFQYFSNILANDAISITGDITPTYCALPIEIFTLIRNGFIQNGIAIKVIFILRDPVEKMWSESKLAIKFKRIRGQKIQGNNSVQEILSEYHQNSLSKKTTEYSTIVHKLQSVFRADEVYFGVYENMHTSTEIERLCNFLGLNHNFNFASKKVNSTPKSDPNEIDLDIKKAIASFYANEYQFCQNLFPQLDIKKLWKNSIYC